MRLPKLMLIPLMALALVASAALRAPAQQADFKPALIVSIASLNEIKGDVNYLLDAAGLKDNAGVAFGLGLVDAMTAGIDKNRPTGAMVMMGKDYQLDSPPDAVVFIPVTDLKGLLALHKDKIGMPEDLGDGLMRIDTNTGEPMFIKEANGWAFAAQKKELLTATPADPAALLGGLDKEYTFAIRINVRNIPIHLREMAVETMKSGFEESLEDLDEEERIFAEGVSRKQLEAMSQLIEEADQVTVGWAVDSMGKKTYLDFSLTGVAGSNLAKSMKVAGETQTAFAGFLLDRAAATMNFAGEVKEDDIVQLTSMMKALSEKALEEIDKDEDLDSAEAKAAAKEILTSLMGIAEETVKSGKVDGGAALLLKPEAITFAAGGHIANGDALEELLKKVVELAKNEPKFPGIKFNADKHEGVRFHTMNIPIPDDQDEPKRFFGENLDVAIGIGAKSVYIAFGKESIGTLKEVIDASKAKAGAKVPPAQLNIALAPIMKFAATVSEDPISPLLADKVDPTKDNISIISQVIERGGRTRIQIEEGVLQLIGEAAKIQQQMAAPGGF